MNNTDIYKVLKEYGDEKYVAGYEAGKADAKKTDPVKAQILKHLQAVYEQGFKDGKEKAIEAMKTRANLPYDAMGDYSGFTADEWYRENFGE